MYNSLQYLDAGIFQVCKTNKRRHWRDLFSIILCAVALTAFWDMGVWISHHICPEWVSSLLSIIFTIILSGKNSAHLSKTYIHQRCQLYFWLFYKNKKQSHTQYFKMKSRWKKYMRGRGVLHQVIKANKAAAIKWKYISYTYFSAPDDWHK